MRKTAVASGIIGVVLVVAAFLLAFWITPAYVARLQSNSIRCGTTTGRSALW